MLADLDFLFGLALFGALTGLCIYGWADTARGIARGTVKFRLTGGSVFALASGAFLTALFGQLFLHQLGFDTWWFPTR